MNKKVLIITVGGTHKPIIKSIELNNPALIVFVESLITFGCEQGRKDWRNKNVRENAKTVILNNDAYGLM